MPRPAQCCRSEQAIVKMAPASDLSLRGGRRPTWRPERAARGSALGVQSREGSHDFADSLPVIRLGTARLPRRFAPRNDTSGEREVHQCPPAVELLPTGRSLSAATGPVGGGCHFNDSLCESFVQCREGTAGPGDALTVRTSHRQNGKRFRLVIARRPQADVAISGRQSRFRRECPVIRLGTARLPRRFAPRNDTSGWCRGAPAPSCG